MNVDFTYFRCHQDELPEEKPLNEVIPSNDGETEIFLRKLKF
jgi:hypothetical protein